MAYGYPGSLDVSNYSYEIPTPGSPFYGFPVPVRKKSVKGEKTVPSLPKVNLEQIKKEITQIPNLASALRQPTMQPQPQTAGPPTFEDLMERITNLGEERTKARLATLRTGTEQVGQDLARELFGRNISPESTLGQEAIQGAITEQIQRVEPESRAVMADILRGVAQQEVQQRGRSQEMLFNLARTGQLQGTAASQALAAQGITDPTALLTDDQFALQQYATAKGLTPEEVLAQRRITAQAFLEDIQKYPERYAGIAEDPEALRQFQLELAEKATPSGGGGKVLCTELWKQGKLDSKIYFADIEYSACINRITILGYHLWAKQIVKLMRKSSLFTDICKPFISAWAYHMAYKMGVVNKRNLFGNMMELIGLPICNLIGRIFIKIKHREGFSHA